MLNVFSMVFLVITVTDHMLPIPMKTEGCIDEMVHVLELNFLKISFV